MKNLTLHNIIKASFGKCSADISQIAREISFVTSDSRNAAEGCLFAAIKGENSDGHDYIAEVFQKGALCCLAQRIPVGCEDLPIILVENTITALGDLAMFYRAQLGTKIIGITGSVGKTTAKEMVSSVLSKRFKVHKTLKNLNNDLGVPLTIFGLDDTHEIGVIEMGISHFGEMKRLAEIVRPDMALYTTIGAAHLEFLHDLDGVLKAKSEMLEFLPKDGAVFVNGDDETLSRLTCSQKICLYGRDEGCAVKAENIRLMGADGMELDIVSEEIRFEAKINSFGIHMVTAALGAAAVALSLGMTGAEIADGIAAYAPVGGRSSLVKTDKITIINDCYNANPTSTMAAMNSLGLLPQRKVAILGDMGELGEGTARLHYDTGFYAGEAGTDLLIACGALSKNTAEGGRCSGCPTVIHFDNKAQLIAKLPELIHAGDAVLVKASHSQAFDEIVGFLQNL